MLCKEVLIIKSDEANNAKSVCNKPEFVNIAKVSVDVELLDFGV